MGFLIAVAVGIVLAGAASFVRPPGSQRRAKLLAATGIAGALGGGFVLGPVLGGGNLFEMMIDPMTPVVTGIGAATLLAVLGAVRMRFSRARSLPTE